MHLFEFRSRHSKFTVKSRLSMRWFLIPLVAHASILISQMLCDLPFRLESGNSPGYLPCPIFRSNMVSRVFTHPPRHGESPISLKFSWSMYLNAGTRLQWEHVNSNFGPSILGRSSVSTMLAFMPHFWFEPLSKFATTDFYLVLSFSNKWDQRVTT